MGDNVKRLIWILFILFWTLVTLLWIISPRDYPLIRHLWMSVGRPGFAWRILIACGVDFILVILFNPHRTKFRYFK